MSINKILNTAFTNFADMVETYETVIVKAVTFDRSKEKYSDNPIEQLRGRAKQIFSYQMLGLFLAAGAATFLISGILYGGIMNYSLGALFGSGAAVCLKEIALQSYARDKDKEDSQTEESERTSYTVSDCLMDAENTMRLIFHMPRTINASSLNDISMEEIP
jgi:hypothetical protein